MIQPVTARDQLSGNPGELDAAQLSKNIGQLKSGDHAELARLVDDPAMDFGGFGRSGVKALIAENAALRASVVKANDGFEEYERKFYLEQDAREEAERKLAEARGLLDRLIGFAVHDEDCTTNRFPGSDVCSCGLSSALQQSRHLSSTEAERG